MANDQLFHWTRRFNFKHRYVVSKPPNSHWARYLKLGEGYTKNWTYWSPFTSAVCANMAGNPGGPSFPSKKLNLWLAEMQFPAVLRGLLALFSHFSGDIPSRSQFLPTLTISMQIWTNCETHIFMWGGMYPRPSVGPPVPPTFIGCRHSGLYYHNSTRSSQVLDWSQNLPKNQRYPLERLLTDSISFAFHQFKYILSTFPRQIFTVLETTRYCDCKSTSANNTIQLLHSTPYSTCSQLVSAYSPDATESSWVKPGLDRISKIKKSCNKI